MDMPTQTTTYSGDTALVARLLTAGVTMSIAAVRAIAAGAAGAPEGRNTWIDLIAPGADAGLRTQLGALKSLIGGEFDGGFTQGAAPEARLTALRAELVQRGLCGFIVPRTDAHLGEYVPPHDERLRWLTGFAGSAGLAIILQDEAAIFVDGRYTIQVQGEVNIASITPRHLTQQPPEKWLADRLQSGDKLGYDPWLHSQNAVERLRIAAQKAGAVLAPQPDNPVDAVWPDQPPPPLSPIVAHALEYTGENATEKRAEIGKKLRDLGCDAVVLSAPDSIAWLLNIRGGDVPRAPMPLSFAIAHDTGAVDLFLDTRKVAPGLGEHLGNGVALNDIATFSAALRAMAGKTVRADPASTAAHIFDCLREGGANVSRGDDPCALPKACKNAVEIAGTKAAHLRDGAALTRFLAWLAETAPGGSLGEFEAAEKLAALRFEDSLIRDLSFDTISGTGPNGAIVHYRVSQQSSRRLQQGDLYLVDSGAQYLDGTTDVTRTIAIGTPSAEMKDRFTRVLKGHIAIATAQFPQGTTGAQLDILARRALWEIGADFDHGTGHGVGSYLSVHEGPHRISKAPSTVPLQVGMIVSNEPGYYKTGAYGIRIENLVTVVPCRELAAAERKMLEFETLTFAPIDRTLIDTGLLDKTEIAWLDAYHARVYDQIAPRVDDTTAAWLQQETCPICG
jgi:Xaa-Pro aminopeptidase